MADTNVNTEQALVRAGVPPCLLRRVVEDSGFARRIALLMRYADRHSMVCVESLALDPNPWFQILPLSDDPTLLP